MEAIPPVGDVFLNLGALDEVLADFEHHHEKELAKASLKMGIATSVASLEPEL